VNIYETLAIATVGSVFSFAAMTVSARSATFFEVGDAGDTFDKAQIITGVSGEALTSIEGKLTSTQDKDYFRFFFGGVGLLTVETGPYFNTPFPSNTFPAYELFNASNSLVGGYFQGEFTVGLGNMQGSSIVFDGNTQLIFSYLSAGEYVLKVDGTGQYNNQKPIYEGDYAIRLSGAEVIPDQSIPEPSTFVGTVIAAGIGWLIKKKASAKTRTKE
jgi:hypothetical protein